MSITASSVKVSAEARPRAIARPAWLTGVWTVGLAAGIGVVLQAYVGYRGRVAGAPPALLFWLSLGLIYVAGVVTIVWLPLTRGLRVLGIALVSIAMQLTRIVLYPDMFVYHDELVHDRVLKDILVHHHLFTANSTLPVTPHYPGLEVVTSGLVQLTGLSTHTCGSLVLLTTRLVLALGIFLIVERMTSSDRIAAAASLIYIANPQYLFFNSQFSYQTIALPLCVGYVYMIVALSSVRRSIAWPALGVVAIAVAVSHHLTSMGLVVLLLAWLAVSTVSGRRPRYLVSATLLALFCVAGWAVIAGPTLFPYFSEILRHNVKSVQQLISGHSDHKFFKDTAGDRTPVWERYASLASVLLLVALLPWALWTAVRRAWGARQAAALVLCAVTVAYPIIPLGHLTEATSEVADRSSGFIFIGVAFVLAWWVFAHLRPGRLGRLPAIAVLLGSLVLFVGGTIVGSGPPWLRAPGPFLVSSENRSVDPIAVSASRWLGDYQRPDQRIYGDRINALLAALLGNQHPLTSLADGIDNDAASRLLLAPLSPLDYQTVRTDRLNLLVVDTRITQDLPHVGVYTDTGEYGTVNRTRPPDPQAVTKFDHVRGAERLYDNGAIRIYALRRIG